MAGRTVAGSPTPRRAARRCSPRRWASTTPTTSPHVFAALADPVRLRLLSLVAARARSARATWSSRSASRSRPISHHTKVLAEAGLIVGEKRGRWMWWRVVPERLDDVRNAPAVRV